MKICTRCKLQKESNECYETHSWCKACLKSYWRSRSTPDGQRQKHLKAFGLTIAQYDEMSTKQDGVCKICGQPETFRRLSVDHDHVSGNVRGLLCINCNVALGGFKDDIKRLQSAISYLTSCL